MDYPKVDSNNVGLNSEVSKVKARWDRATQRDFNNQGEEVTDQEELRKAKTVDEKLEENSYRERYNHSTKELSFANVIPSDIKSNPRVILPKPRSDKEEGELATRSTMVNLEVMEFIKKMEQTPTSMTKSERRGMRKLKKRT